MNRFIAAPVRFTAIFVVVSLAAAGAMEMKPAKTDEKAQPTLIPNLGSLRHSVSTTSPEAQQFFDQGLTLIYAFNHEEAVRSFQTALDFDPVLAMAYWGQALALGPNINLDVDPEREKAAYDAAQKALALAPRAPENERAYIEALAKRYSKDPKADLKQLAVDYKNAMGGLVKRYPDDLDAATLYAESMMDLHPWKLWSRDGTPTEGTLEIVATLDSVLRRDPNHIGANHYYIHAVEASPHPEWGLTSAHRLESLVPAAGHLVHMPGHIYFRVGDYHAAAEANERAVLADRAYMRSAPPGFYPAMYYGHNLHFLAVACAMEGRTQAALQAADAMKKHLDPVIAQMPMLDGFNAMPQLIYVKLRQWNEVIAWPRPSEKLPLSTAAWHFSRGVAYAETNRVREAEREQSSFRKVVQKTSKEAAFDVVPATDVFTVMEHVLAGRIARAKGDKRGAIVAFQAGVAAEDNVAYVEPPPWCMPVREALGAALLTNGQAAEAESVFRTDLQHNPRSGRSLFGLLESLKAQGKSDALPFIQSEFDAAWRYADITLRIEELE